MSNNINIPVQNYDINKIVTNVQINNVSVSLYRSASINCCLCDTNGNALDVRTVNLSEEEYNNWLTDDYLVQLVLQKIGLVPVNNN